MDELEKLRAKRLEKLKSQFSPDDKEKKNMTFPDKSITLTGEQVIKKAGEYPLLVVDCWAPW